MSYEEVVWTLRDLRDGFVGASGEQRNQLSERQRTAVAKAVAVLEALERAQPQLPAMLGSTSS